jgi:hypothetical protein
MDVEGKISYLLKSLEQINKFCLLKDESTKVPISSGGQPNVCDYSFLLHVLVSGSNKIFSQAICLFI